MNHSPAILGIGTAAPPPLQQEQIAEMAAGLTCRTDQQSAWLHHVFARSGIKTRGSVLTMDPKGTGVESLQAFYPPPRSPQDMGPTTTVRMARYAAEAPPLAQAACLRALDHAQTAASAITHLITVSCTGFFAPGLDEALITRLGLPPSVHRIHIGFMGCHAAFNALGAARDAARADPQARILVCCVELCSLHFAYGWDPQKVVANALFADGAGAAVVGQDEDRPDLWRLRDTASFLIPDSRPDMTWTITHHGFEMTLARTIPEAIARHLESWCAQWLRRHELRIDQVENWAVHPGGPKILSAVAEGLALPSDALRLSRRILACHGNMSSATILFILQRMMHQALSRPCVAIGLGPGLMAEGMLFE
jgi:predicted naringenin-chalcone synthase